MTDSEVKYVRKFPGHKKIGTVTVRYKKSKKRRYVGGLIMIFMVILITFSWLWSNTEIRNNRIIPTLRYYVGVLENYRFSKFSQQCSLETILDEPDDGMTYIKANTTNELLYAQGYAHARDRLFQMDLLRRLSVGTGLSVSEAPYGKSTDEHKLSTFEMEMLEAYTSGINAYIDCQNQYLPIGFVLAGAGWTYKVFPWTASHSLNIMQYYTNEIARPTSNESDISLLRRMDAVVMIPAVHGSAAVVSGNHTKSRGSVMINDMHGKVSGALPMPGYYKNTLSLSSGRGDSGSGLLAAGVSLPGIPFVLMGHNDHIAWSWTVPPRVRSDNSEYFKDQCGELFTDFMNSNFVQFLWRVNTAETWADYLRAAGHQTDHSLNMLYADTRGNIGVCHTAARYFFASAHTCSESGSTGTCDADMCGAVKDSPSIQATVIRHALYNPAEGVIFSADGPVLEPPRVKPYVSKKVPVQRQCASTGCSVSSRMSNDASYPVARLKLMINDKNVTGASLIELWQSVHSPSAVILMTLIEVLTDYALNNDRIDELNNNAQRVAAAMPYKCDLFVDKELVQSKVKFAYQIIATFDGQYTFDSKVPLLIETLREQLLQLLMRSAQSYPSGAQSASRYCFGKHSKDNPKEHSMHVRLMNMLKEFLRDPMLERGTRTLLFPNECNLPCIFTAALTGAVDKCDKLYGMQIENWPTWGQVHNVMPTLPLQTISPILDAVFGRGPIQLQGSLDTLHRSFGNEMWTINKLTDGIISNSRVIMDSADNFLQSDYELPFGQSERIGSKSYN